MPIITAIEPLQEDAPPKYRKIRPPDRALVVIQYGMVLVLDSIGPGVGYFADMGELDDALCNDAEEGLIGVYIWEGEVKTSFSEYTREHEAWLEGKWRLVTEEEWSNHLNGEAVWDSSEWLESEETSDHV